MTSISPSFGTISGSTVVTIRGSGFTSALSAPSVCRLMPSGVTIVPTFSTDTLLTCKPPAQPSLLPSGFLMRLEVVNGDGKGGIVVNTDPRAADFGMAYRYFSPAISSLRPSVSMLVGGSFVTIIGRDILYDPALSVCYCKIRAQQIQIPVSRMLTNISSAVVCGPFTGLETATPQTLMRFEYNLNGQESVSLENAIYLAPSPTVASIFPSAFPTQTGGVLTIVGNYFYDNPALKCRFGGSTGIEVSATYNGESNCTCVVPAVSALTYSDPKVQQLQGQRRSPLFVSGFSPSGPVAVDVSLDGQFYVSAGSIRYYSSPSVSSIAPSVARAGEGVTVTLSGSDFSNSIFDGSRIVLMFGQTRAQVSFINSATLVASVNIAKGMLLVSFFFCKKINLYF